MFIINGVSVTTHEVKTYGYITQADEVITELDSIVDHFMGESNTNDSYIVVRSDKTPDVTVTDTTVTETTVADTTETETETAVTETEVTDTEITETEVTENGETEVIDKIEAEIIEITKVIETSYPTVEIYEKYEAVDRGYMYNGTKTERRLVMIFTVCETDVAYDRLPSKYTSLVNEKNWFSLKLDYKKRVLCKARGS